MEEFNFENFINNIRKDLSNRDFIFDQTVEHLAEKVDSVDLYFYSVLIKKIINQMTMFSTNERNLILLIFDLMINKIETVKLSRTKEKITKMKNETDKDKDKEQ